MGAGGGGGYCKNHFLPFPGVALEPSFLFFLVVLGGYVWFQVGAYFLSGCFIGNGYAHSKL